VPTSHCDSHGLILGTSTVLPSDHPTPMEEGLAFMYPFASLGHARHPITSLDDVSSPYTHPPISTGSVCKIVGPADRSQAPGAIWSALPFRGVWSGEDVGSGCFSVFRRATREISRLLIGGSWSQGLSGALTLNMAKRAHKGPANG